MRENVLIYGRYFGLSRRELRPRIEELLDFVQLTERAATRSSRSRADEAAPDDRALARQRPRPASARRADDRPRPAGATSSGTGSSGSSSAARRSSSRRTTWTRRSSSATASSSWTAARSSPRARPGADPALLDPRGRDPLRARAAAEREARRVAERVEELPDRVLLYTRDGDATAAAVAERACRRTRRSSAGARSRTSSSTSPAAR